MIFLNSVKKLIHYLKINLTNFGRVDEVVLIFFFTVYPGYSQQGYPAYPTAPAYPPPGAGPAYPPAGPSQYPPPPPQYSQTDPAPAPYPQKY